MIPWWLVVLAPPIVAAVAIAVQQLRRRTRPDRPHRP